MFLTSVAIITVNTAWTGWFFVSIIVNLHWLYQNFINDTTVLCLEKPFLHNMNESS